MADQPNIFNDQNPGGNPSNDDPSKVNATQDAELTTLLMNIKNERGEPKYKTVKDAIIGLQNAQEYIPGLKDKLKTLEEQVAASSARDAELDTLRETVKALAGNGGGSGTPPVGLSPEQIADLVNKSLETTLTAREQAAVQKQNVSQVVTSMKEAFGDKAEEKFKEKATEMGMTIAEFNALAAKSPATILTVLGVKAKNPQDSFKPSSSSVNSSAYQPLPNSNIGRNKVPTLVGATSQDLANEAIASRKMVDELHEQGMSVHDLTDPKKYFKLFGQ